MKSIDLNEEQLQKMKAHPGFIAALDQSGGSTPGAAACGWVVSPLAAVM